LFPLDAALNLQILGAAGWEIGPEPLARDLHRPQQRLQRAGAGTLVRPFDPVSADDLRGGRRLRPPVEMRLQQLPHQLPPLLLQQGFEIAVGHARRLL
jgi:hypothetical protein